MTPSTSSILPFRFRPRREKVDWRRINTVDVDLVVSQLDVDALQEHITNITFCNLEDERCQRCHSHLDPVLIKLLRLAQLSIEWLMNCQDFQAANLREAEERVAAGHKELELLLAQQKEQEENVKMLTAELKQRKKIIKMQQTMLNTNGKKCPHCEKKFLNTTFLQSHKQRRHPEEYEMELKSISEMKSQIERLKLELSNLKKQTVEQQQDLQTRTDQDKKWDDRLQEIKTQHESETNKLLNKLSSIQSENNQLWQEEMSRKLQEQQENKQRLQELQENKQQLQEEMTRRLQEQQENKQQLQEEMSRRLQEQQENNQRLQEEKTRRLQELQENNQQLQEEMSRMQSEYDQRLQEEMNRRLQEQQENKQQLQEEMSRRLQEQQENKQQLQEEMNRMQSEYDQRLQEEMSRRLQQQQENKQQLQEEMSRRLQEQQENKQLLQEEMSRRLQEQQENKQQLQEEVNRMQSEYDQRLQEKEQTIKVQRKQIRNISPHPPKIMKVPVMVSDPAPEPKTKRVILDSSSVPERRPVEKKPESVVEKRKPKIKKEMRLNVVQALNRKQENLGVKPDRSRLTDKKFIAVQAKLHSDRDSIAKRVPDYWHCREEIKSTMEQLVIQRRGRDSAPESQTRSRQSVQDSSNVSKRRPVEKKPESVAEKRKPKIKKEMRPNVVQDLNEKQENLGVKPDRSRLADKKPSSILVKVHSKLKSVAKGMPGFRHHVKEKKSTMEQLVSLRRGSYSTPESQTRSRQSVQVSQILPTKTVGTKIESDEEDGEDWSVISKLLETGHKPKPSPESQRPERQCGEQKLCTPPFSSAEESEGEDPEKEQPQIRYRGKLPQSRLIQVQPSTSKTSPVQTIQAPAKYSSSNFHQTKGSVPKTADTQMESDKEDDDDWSEILDLQEVDRKPLQNRRDQNSNVENRNFGEVSQILPTKTVGTKMEIAEEDGEDWLEISELLET